MAEYIKQEMSDLDGSGEQRVFYRMKTYHNINAREFVSKLARPGSGLSEGNVLHVLTTLADELAHYMAQGGNPQTHFGNSRRQRNGHTGR